MSALAVSGFFLNFRMVRHGSLVIGGIAVGILLLLEIIVMPLYVRQNKSQYLIDVTYKSLNQAQQILRAEGFKVVINDTLYSSDFEPNTVVDQFPEPSTRVKTGRTIHLKISKLNKLVEVPNLIGQSQRSADILLKTIGLTIDTVYTEYNPDFPNGTVAWQSPRGGELLMTGLGLHIVYNLVVNTLGGKIRVKSETNKGIDFSMDVPYHGL